MSNEPIIAPSVVAEPVPEPKVEVPPMPESVWVLVVMKKWIDSNWKPSVTSHASQEDAASYLEFMQNFSGHKTVYHPHIVKIELKAQPKPEENPREAAPETGVLSIIAQYMKEHHSLQSKLAEVEAANAELRARLDAIKLHPCE